MANQKQAAAKRMSMAERAQKQLELHFPGFPAQRLWRRKTNDGFTTLPRTMPLVMQAIDAQSKGQPAGHTLLCLWVRSPDNPFLTIENPATFASETGFEGERAVDTWRRRMRRLQELGFIETKPGPSGDFHYVLLLNPNVAVEEMYMRGHVQLALYGRFVDRLIEVGGFGEIEAIRALWEQERVARAATQAEVVQGAPDTNPGAPSVNAQMPATTNSV